MGDLVASIEEKRGLEPNVAIPMEDGFQVVAGFRRLGMSNVPCRVFEFDDRRP